LIPQALVEDGIVLAALVLEEDVTAPRVHTQEDGAIASTAQAQVGDEIASAALVQVVVATALMLQA